MNVFSFIVKHKLIVIHVRSPVTETYFYDPNARQFNVHAYLYGSYTRA